VLIFFTCSYSDEAKHDCDDKDSPTSPEPHDNLVPLADHETMNAEASTVDEEEPNDYLEPHDYLELIADYEPLNAEARIVNTEAQQESLDYSGLVTRPVNIETDEDHQDENYYSPVNVYMPLSNMAELSDRTRADSMPIYYTTLGSMAR